MAAYPEYLVKYIKKYFNGAQINTAYEAGFSGFYLHRYLLKQNINNIVVHPAAIRIAVNDRVKTDKRDSLKIAKQLATGELKGIHIPSEAREDFRILTRTRDQLLKTRKRIGNQLKSLLFTQGLIDPYDDTKANAAWIKRVQQMPLIGELKYSIDLLIESWIDLNNKLKKILKKLREQKAKDNEIDIVYRSVPGIGALSARILANELEDLKRFSNVKSLFSYTGLTPSEHSSGEYKRQGSISRQGRSYLRMILIQIAWRSITIDDKLSKTFERISKKAGKKRAIVAIARKIIGCIRSCFINNRLWCTNAPIYKEHYQTKVEAC